MINAYDEAVKLLPAKTAAALGKELRCAEEFRLRTGYAMTALIDGRELPVSDTSVTQEDIACVIEKATRASVHTVQLRLRTAPRRLRHRHNIGLCGIRTSGYQLSFDSHTS